MQLVGPGPQLDVTPNDNRTDDDVVLFALEPSDRWASNEDTTGVQPENQAGSSTDWSILGESLLAHPTSKISVTPDEDQVPDTTEPSSPPTTSPGGANSRKLLAETPPGRLPQCCRGVYFDQMRHLWRANWPEETVVMDRETQRTVDVKRCTRTKGFSAKKHGFFESQRLAIAHRARMIHSGLVRHYVYSDDLNTVKVDGKNDSKRGLGGGGTSSKRRRCNDKAKKDQTQRPTSKELKSFSTESNAVQQQTMTVTATTEIENCGDPGVHCCGSSDGSSTVGVGGGSSSSAGDGGANKLDNGISNSNTTFSSNLSDECCSHDFRSSDTPPAAGDQYVPIVGVVMDSADNSTSASTSCSSTSPDMTARDESADFSPGKDHWLNRRNLDSNSTLWNNMGLNFEFAEVVESLGLSKSTNSHSSSAASNEHSLLQSNEHGTTQHHLGDHTLSNHPTLNDPLALWLGASTTDPIPKSGCGEIFTLGDDDEAAPPSCVGGSPTGSFIGAENELFSTINSSTAVTAADTLLYRQPDPYDSTSYNGHTEPGQFQPAAEGW